MRRDGMMRDAGTLRLMCLSCNLSANVHGTVMSALHTQRCWVNKRFEMKRMGGVVC